MNGQERPWPCIKCRVIMEGIDEDHCKCPVCGTEVWYDYKEDMEKPEEIDSIMRIPSGQTAGQEYSILGGPPAKGGGNSSGSKSKRKQLLKKLSCKEIYKRMCREKK